MGTGVLVVAGSRGLSASTGLLLGLQGIEQRGGHSSSTDNFFSAETACEAKQREASLSRSFLLSRSSSNSSPHGAAGLERGLPWSAPLFRAEPCPPLPHRPRSRWGGSQCSCKAFFLEKQELWAMTLI